jgi:hypothetical protein
MGSWYWSRATCVGTSITATLYKDAGGYIGDQVATLTTVCTGNAATGTGVCGLVASGASGSALFGGNYPGTFLVQGPLPSGVTIVGNNSAYEPAYCWSKTGAYAGSYSISVFQPISAPVLTTWAQVPVSPSYNPNGAIGTIAGYAKVPVGANADMRLWGATKTIENNSFTANGQWGRASASASIDGAPPFVALSMGGTGTVYFDNVVVQQGSYANEFVDQVPLAGSSGAGSQTVFSIAYQGAVKTRPVWTIKIPASNTVTITQLKLQNTNSGEVLTINFTTPLAALTTWTITIDTDAYTIKDQNGTLYDPVGSFPKLYPPVGTANSFTATVITGSGTSSGVTLDTTFTKLWEVQAA